VTAPPLSCADAAARLDAFVDTELSGPELLEVARHVAGCVDCDRQVGELVALHEALAMQVDAASATLDLRRLWPRLDAAADVVDRRRAWRRRLRRVPAWGAAAMAIAAGALVWVRSAPVAPERLASRVRPNQAVIERIVSDGGRVELRRDRKYGTTLIMVSAVDQEAMP
jgi:anti-sigma factor RsiW